MLDAATTRQILALALLVPISLGLGFSALWLLHHGWTTLFPPPLHDRAVRWGFAEIILAFAALVVIPNAQILVLQKTGFFRAIYGEDPNLSDQSSDSFLRCMVLWAGTIALPILAVLTLALVRCISGARLRHLGLRWQRLPSGIAAGFVAWTLVTVPVFALHYGVVALQQRVFHWPPQKHPLEQLLQRESTPAEWLLLVLQAVVFAPVWEELLFRGLLLPRLAKHAWGGRAAWAAATALAALHLDERWSWQSAAPLVFVVVARGLTVALTWRETGPYWKWRAILGSAALFAALHSAAWPSPVALLPLGIALGWLADRTRGLIAPIVLHALFNSVSTLLLLRGWVETV